MKLAIWGAGSSGKKIYEIIKENLLNDKVVCFVDSDCSKLDLSLEIPIVSVFYLKNMLDGNGVDYVIIPGYEHMTFREIQRHMYNADIDYRKCMYYSTVGSFRRNAKEFKCFEKMLKKSENKLPSICCLEYEVSEKCNLNCSGCCHYSNLLEKNSEHGLATLSEYENDLKRILDISDDIREIFLLGGDCPKTRLAGRF